MHKKLHIARVSTVPFFVLTQLKSQIDAFASHGMRVTVITSAEDFPGQMSQIQHAGYIAVNISRNISLARDIVSLIKLFRLFRSRKFDVVHSTTPKAGLLCAIASRVAGVPIRLHTFTGQPWATMSGVKKNILKSCDKVIGALSTHCYADSSTQKNFLVENSIIKKDRLSVLGHGSLAGVDLTRFNKAKYSCEFISQLRSTLGIPLNGKVILFVGRITPEKGIQELMDAFVRVAATDHLIHLLLVGPVEEKGGEIIDAFTNDSAWTRVHQVGFTNEPEKFMASADLLCLPSYREGFGTVVIEAAAMGIPTVGTSIYGLSDAVVEGVTGLLVPPQDADALARALARLLDDSTLLREFGKRANMRAVEEFDSVKMSSLMLNEYERFCR
ncbi:glycosyltransferase [Pseudomonas sp. MAFF 311095]|uniref:Glycosyltransferase n=2 Tax=Pseudomonas petroselini TaxID=2899822 RepID=A0ABS8QXB8_9PSED|nr:glycosyltransferase [Pseudomonas petroselini]MCD7040370.1 glycosyltransferase [Pseudomonas petroselini]MCD7069014.1 glycosyltransferase [Pseudomonas petroselini]MCD7079637.1 glycosyltransferase [Pseudomonas petroselini]